MARRRVLTEEMVSMRTKCTRMDLIKNLNLWGNDLEDISVLQSMPNLEVLSLSVNSVNSLADLKCCSKLSELYLRKNEIADLSEVLTLRHLRKLKVLWLSDNPCASLPHYRQYILQHLPGLTKLDSQDVTEEERRRAVEADLGCVQTCVAGMARDDADMPDFSPLARRGGVDPEFEDGPRSQGGLESPSEWGQPVHAGRPSRSLSGNEFIEQYQSPADISSSASLNRSTELARDGYRDSAGMRNSQVRPSPTSPTAASPQWQQRSQQRRPSGAGSPTSVDAAMEREPPIRASEQAWSTEYAHERAQARGDLRGGGSSTRPPATRGRTSSNGCEQTPNSQSFSEDGLSPAQPLSATDNILCAVLALIKELDTQGLELVRRAVEQRQEDVRQ